MEDLETIVNVVGQKEILAVIPHGEEALYIDRAWVLGEKEVEGFRHVTAADCAGHFSAEKGLPQILSAAKMLEMAWQAGSCLVLNQSKFLGRIAVVTWNKAKFMRAVCPGEDLVLRVKLMKWKDKRTGVAIGRGFVNAEEVSWVLFGFKIIPARAL